MQFNNAGFKPIKFDGSGKNQKIEKLNKIVIAKMRILSIVRKELYGIYSKNKEN